MSGEDLPLGERSRAAEPRPATRWGAVSVVLVVLVSAGVFAFALIGNVRQSGIERELAEFAPTEVRPDPSTHIAGVVITQYSGGVHVDSGRSGPGPLPARPPSGGAHATVPAPCAGVASPTVIPIENAVHSLEHGAVWITYDPARASESVVQALTARTSAEPFLMLSPYPGLDAPISLQAWGHQLTLDSPRDPRFEQFIRALRDNPRTVPEPDGTC